MQIKRIKKVTGALLFTPLLLALICALTLYGLGLIIDWAHNEVMKLVQWLVNLATDDINMSDLSPEKQEQLRNEIEKE
jgi:hypothetical protein